MRKNTTLESCETGKKKEKEICSRSEELSKLRSSCMMIFTQYIPNSIKLLYVQEMSLQVEMRGTMQSHTHEGSRERSFRNANINFGNFIVCS